MNKVYRVVWNAAKGVWQVVSEIGTRKGKTKTRRDASPVLKALGTGGLLLASGSLFAGALPTGGQVVGGKGSISVDGDHMTINQGTDHMAIDWTGFSIGEANTVQFIQPGTHAAALNRVTGDQVSDIRGSLLANGQVFLVNPNGILFGQAAQVDVGGLVASTLDISAEDFMAGNYSFEGSSGNAVINHGRLAAAEGGFVVMIAAQVENHGDIFANDGSVLLGAGQRVRLDMGGPVKLEVQAEALAALIKNGGAIYAQGGTVMLTARAAENLSTTVINHTGVIDAQSVEAGENGQIVLHGEGGITEVAGTLNAGSDTGVGGSITVTGDYVGLMAGAELDASGRDGGGSVKVGGGFQGRDAEVVNAKRTYVDADASIKADALEQGDGGQVIVWADDATRFNGEISARGGEAGGDGGFAEVSGKQYLDYRGTTDLRATNGEAGTLLLDPTDLTIVAGNSDNGVSNGTPFEPSAAGSTLNWGTIESALSKSNVEITTDNDVDSGQDGNITVQDGHAYTSPYELKLTTAGSGGVVINGAITNNGTGNFAVDAGNGGIAVNQALNFVGGNVTLETEGGITGTAEGTITTSAAENTGAASGRVTLSGAQGVNLAGGVNTSSSDNKLGQVGNAGQIIVASAAGSVTLNSLTATGGNNTYSPSDILSTGGSGGQGGGITVTAGNGSVAIGDVNTAGGVGQDGVGGGGGTVTIRTTGTDDHTDNSIAVGAITTTGGNNTLGGFNGGNAGNIRLETANNATITLNGDLAAVGGAGTDPSPQGLGGHIRFTGAVELSGDRIVNTGNTTGNVNFDSTIDSQSDNSPYNLKVTAGTGKVYFNEAIGSGNNEARELKSLTVTAAEISARRNITARDGLSFSASQINLGDKDHPTDSGLVFNTNRDNGTSHGDGAMVFNGSVNLKDHLTLTRGAGDIKFNTGGTNIRGDMAGGNRPDLTVNGTGAEGRSDQGHVSIGTGSTAMADLGHISLSQIGNLSISGNITAKSLIYQNRGTGNVTIGASNASTQSFSESVGVDGKAHGVLIETEGTINLSSAIQATEAGAALSVTSTANDLELSSVSSGLSTNNGDIHVAGIGVTQTNSSSASINANGGQIVIDGGGAAISLGARVETTYDESADGHDGTAVLLRNATNISVESVIATNGTLQFGTPSSDFSGDPDVTGNVSQSAEHKDGIDVKTVAANIGGNLTITSIHNAIAELGLIELDGDLSVRSDSGPLSLTQDITAKSAAIQVDGAVLEIGGQDITTTEGNIILRGRGVNQDAGSVINAGNGKISIDGRDIDSNSTGNIALEGKLITTSVADDAVKIAHSYGTNSTIWVGDIEAEAGKVLIGDSNYSGAISQTWETTIKANALEVNSRSTISLANNNEINDLTGVRYGGTVNIKSLDGLRLTGSVDRWNSSYSHSAVTLHTEGDGDALLDLNGQNIYGAGVNLYGKGVQSHGGTINGQGGDILINAGGGLIDLAGASLTTTSTSGTAVQLLNAGDDVILGNITAKGENASGTLVLGGEDGLNIAGSITQADVSRLEVGRIVGNTTGAVDLSNSNNLIRTGTNAGSLGDFSAGGPFSLVNAATEGLNVNGTVVASNGDQTARVDIETGGKALNLSGSIAGDGVSLEARNNTGHLILNGNIEAGAGDVSLVAEGRNTVDQRSIVQSGGAITTTGALTGQAADRVLLERDNDIAQLGPFTTSANEFVLNNSGRDGSLTLIGDVATPSGPATITTGGLLDLATFDITSNSGLITLNAIGISQSAGSVVNPGGGNANEGAGAVGGILLNAGGGDVILAGTLTTTNTTDHAIRIQNAGQVQLGTVVAGSGRVTLGFNVDGKRISDDVTQLGTMNAKELEVFTAGSVVLNNGGNLVTTLNAVHTEGDFILLDSNGGLELNGDVLAKDNGHITIATQGNPLQLKAFDVTAEGSGNIRLEGVGISSLVGSSIDGGTGMVLLDGLNTGTGSVSLQGLVTTDSNSDAAVVIQRASSVTFAGIETGASGTVALGSEGEGLGIAGTVSQTGALVTGTLRGASGGVELTNTANRLTKLGPYINTKGGFSLYSGHADGLTLVGDVTTVGTTRIETQGALNLDTYNLLATGSTLELIADGISQSTEVRDGASQASTLEGASTQLLAGTGDINLLSANNNFTGQVKLATTGASAGIRDRDALNLASLNRQGDTGLGDNTGITAIAGTTLSLTQEGISTGSGDIELRALGGDLQTVGTLTTTSGDIHVEASGTLTVNHALTTTSGDLALSAEDVTLARSIEAGGAVTVTNDGVLSTLSGVEILADGGFTQAGAGSNELRGDILTDGGDIQFAGDILLDDDVTLSTGLDAGSINLEGTVNSKGSARNLSLLSGGAFELTASVGDSSALDTLFIAAKDGISQADGTLIDAAKLGLVSLGNIKLDNDQNAIDVVAAHLGDDSDLALKTSGALTLGEVSDLSGTSLSGISDHGGNASATLIVGGQLSQAENARIELGGDLTIDTTAFDGANVHIDNSGADAGTVLGNSLVAGDFTLVSNGEVTQLKDGQGVDLDAFLQVGGSFTIENDQGMPVHVFVEGNASADNVFGGGAGTLPGLVRLPGKLTLSMHGTELTVTSDVAGFAPVVLDIATLGDSPVVIVSSEGQRTLIRTGMDLDAFAVNLNQANRVNGTLAVTTRGAVTGTDGDVATGIGQSSGLTLGDVSFEVRASEANTLDDGHILLDHADNHFNGQISLLNEAGGDATLASATDLLLGDVNVGGGTLTLNAGTHAIGQAADAKLIASSLALTAGDATFDQHNRIDTLSGNLTGDLDFTNGQALRLGIDGGEGIVSTGGDIQIRTTEGDLALANTSGAAVATGGAGNIELVSGGNVINDKGADALATGEGHWRIWSESPELDDLNGLAPDFKQYNAVHGDSEKGLVLGTGNGLLYSLAPELTVTLTGTVERDYDGTDTAILDQANFVISGTLDGDAITLQTTGHFDDRHVFRDASGNVIGGKTVTVTPEIATVTKDGVTVYGYRLANTEALSADIGKINPIDLVVSGITAQSRVYDGTTNAAIDVAGAQYDGLFGADQVQVTATGQFADKNVANGLVVTLESTYEGADVGNYNIIGQTTTEADITPFVINLDGSRTYDGTLNVDAGDLSLGALVGDETLNLTGTGLLNDKHAGANKAVDLGTLALADGSHGGLASNYSLIGGSHTLDVERASVSFTTTDVVRGYDGSLNAAGTAIVTTGSALAEGDSFDGGQFAFVDANAGEGKRVTVSNVNIEDGNGGNNYLIDYVDNTTSTINRAAITVSTSDVVRTYDGTKAAGGTAVVVEGELFHNASNGGLQDSLSGGQFAFTDANVNRDLDGNVLQNKEVTVGNVTLLDGNGGGNYDITYVSNTTSAITPFAVDLSGTRIYDGTTDVLVADLVIGELVGDETLSLSGQGGVADRHVANGKTIILGSLALEDGINGGLASNYTFVGGTQTLDITKRAISVSGIAAADRVYDGTTEATVDVSGAVFTNIVDGDDLSVSASGQFTDRNAGQGKTVLLDSSYDGADLANYEITDQASTTASIDKRAISVSGITAADRVYDGTTEATLDVSGAVFNNVVAGDDLSVSASGQFTDRNAGEDKIVLLDSNYDGADLANYEITDQNAALATISPFAVDLSGTRTYDGSAEVGAGNLVIGALIGTETLGLAGYGLMTDANVANGKHLDVSALNLVDGDNGGLASNYTFVGGSQTVDITPYVINLNGTRVYDATSLVLADVLQTGALVGNETLRLSGIAYAGSRHVTAEAQSLTDVSNLSLLDGTGGGLASNYTLVGGDHRVRFTPAALKVNGLVAQDKVYDGTDSVQINMSAALPLVLGHDQVTLERVTGKFLTTDAGTDLEVVATDLVLAGEDAANYVAVPVTGLQADITPRQLNVTAHAENRYFDGTNVVNLTLTDDRLSGDEFELAYTAAFTDAGVGQGKFVRVGDLTITGADAGNYLLPQQVSTYANILPRPITETSGQDRQVAAKDESVLRPLAPEPQVNLPQANADRGMGDNTGLRIVERSSESDATQTPLVGGGRDENGFIQVVVVDGGIRDEDLTSEL